MLLLGYKPALGLSYLTMKFEFELIGKN